MFNEILGSVLGEVKPERVPANEPAPGGRHGLCLNCEQERLLTRSGACLNCGSHHILPVNPSKCRICGGGTEEGDLLAGKAHPLCIPTNIRREGVAAMESFVRRLV